MAAGLLSGLLLLGIGVWIIEGWIVEHGRPVVRQAYRSLATDLGTLRFVMRWCVVGSKDHADTVPVGTGVDEDCLRPVFDAMRSAPPTGYWKRLRHLMRDDAWRDATINVLRVYRRQLHQAAGSWSAVLLTSRALTDDLSRLADLTEEIGRLNGALADEDIVDDVIGMWTSVQRDAADLEERFYAAARARPLDPRHVGAYRPRRRRIEEPRSGGASSPPNR